MKENSILDIIAVSGVKEGKQIIENSENFKD